MENHHNCTNVTRKKFDVLLLAILDSLAFSPWPPVKSPFWRVWRRRDTLERSLQHNLSHENCLLFANVVICRRHHNRWLVQPTVIEYIKFIETIECLFTWVVLTLQTQIISTKLPRYIILISIVNTHAKGSYIKSIFHFNLKLLNTVHYILTSPVPKPCLQTNTERDN